MARNLMTLKEWCTEEATLKLEFLKKEASTPQGLLVANGEKIIFSNRYSFKEDMNLIWETDSYFIQICNQTFKKLKDRFRTFKHNARNREEKRIKKQLTLDKKTNQQFEFLCKKMEQPNLNDCLSELIDFYIKNKAPRLKSDLKLKSLKHEIEELSDFIQEQNKIIYKQNEMIAKNNSVSVGKEKLEKKIELLKDKLLDERFKNWIFEEYKNMLPNDVIKNFENHLAESDFQSLKDKIKESIDTDLSMIDWMSLNSSTESDVK